MIELLGLIYAAGLLFLGFSGAPWWWTLIAAVLGTILYVLLRSHVILRDIQGGQVWITMPLYYITQVITAAILFGLGRLIGFAF